MGDRHPERDAERPEEARETTDFAPSVLGDAGSARSYQILTEIAERQPAVSQREIAESLGVSAQSVSDYVGRLVDEGYVRKRARGRYEVSKRGVDWLISQTEELRDLADYVSEEVIGRTETEAALATDAVAEGDRVSLSMADGVLRATPFGQGDGGDVTADGGGDGDRGASAVAVTNAEAGREVGVAAFEGVIDHEPGDATVVVVPRVHEGGSDCLDPAALLARHDNHDLLAVSDAEAVAAARAAELTPDIRFGTAAATREAAAKGLDVLVLLVASDLPRHADRFREMNLGYEVLDARDL